MKTVDIACPIKILKDLKEHIISEDWVNEEGQRHVAGGIDLAIGRLRKHGFIEISEEELAVAPLPKADPNQLEFNLNR